MDVWMKIAKALVDKVWAGVRELIDNCQMVDVTYEINFKK